MDIRGAPGPKSYDRRYASLEDTRKNLYYAMRRHLGYTPAEVDAMCVQERRMWVEKLNQEFSSEEDDTVDTEASDDPTEFGIIPTSIA